MTEVDIAHWRYLSELAMRQAEHYQIRAHAAERMLSRTRGQWINSVHAQDCISVLTAAGYEPAPMTEEPTP